MAVVKANAYGHGLVPTALALADADAFAVARLEEGLALRAAGITQPIVLLEGVFTSEQLSEAARHGFELVVHDALQVELLEEMTGQHRFVIWIKIDTGMNRLGFPVREFAGALARVQRLPVTAVARFIRPMGCTRGRHHQHPCIQGVDVSHSGRRADAAYRGQHRRGQLHCVSMRKKRIGSSWAHGRGRALRDRNTGSGLPFHTATARSAPWPGAVQKH